MERRDGSRAAFGGFSNKGKEVSYWAVRVFALLTDRASGT